MDSWMGKSSGGFLWPCLIAREYIKWRYPGLQSPDISLIVPQDFQPSFRRSACNGLAANQKKTHPSIWNTPRNPWFSCGSVHVGGRMGVHISEKGFRYKLSATCSRASLISIVPGVPAWETSVCVCLLFWTWQIICKHVWLIYGNRVAVSRNPTLEKQQTWGYSLEHKGCVYVYVCLCLYWFI